MRGWYLLLILPLLLSSCKNDQQEGETKGLTIDQVRYKGEYLHYGNTAVLTVIGNGDIHAVQIDEKSAELDKQAAPYKKSPYDMVKVVLTGELVPNPFLIENGEGWEQMLIIDEIIEVRPSSNQTVTPSTIETEEN